MKKKVVMWLKSKNNKQLPKFDGEKSEAYHEFFRRASKKFDFYVVLNLSSYLGEAIFKNVAVYKDGMFKFINKDKIKADVIYHYNFVVKDEKFDPSPARIINSPSFKVFGSNKLKQYNLLKNFFPKSIFLPDMRSIKECVDKKTTNETIVLKPVQGSNGQGVIVSSQDSIDYSDIDKDQLNNFGYINQEFIDTSLGISNIVDGVHDLRIMTMIDNIVLCHVRAPEDNSMIANTHKGALMREITFNCLPDKIKDFYYKVHNKIRTKYKTPLYSMDLGLDKDGSPLLFEINAHTAFPRKDFKSFDLFINTLITTLDEL